MGLGSIFKLFRFSVDELGRKGLVISGGVLLILAIFLVPLVPALLDLFIATNLLVALVLLLRSLFVRGSSGLFAFPAILLFTTLFRLGLNVSSTRLILLNGDQGLSAAGDIIGAFGSFVVKGDFIVGAIIFVVIALVNFIVIAKGSSRVAEVAARFALDALPGKQIAIDSDLRAGLISRDEAVRRRDEVIKESQFYGAMDGSMRFVQGDAIAGLIITFINAVGGMSLGVYRGMEVGAAMNTFGVLTVGDGLVSILPSLVISISAGLVVTRVSSKEKFTQIEQLADQLSHAPQALVIGAIALISLGFIPGFPILPFLIVGFGLLFVVSSGFLGSTQEFSHGYVHGLKQPQIWSRLKDGRLKRLDYQVSDDLTGEKESILDLVLEVDEGLLKPYLLDNRERFKSFVDLFDAHRTNLLKERGVVVPMINIIENPSLSLGEYRVLVRDKEKSRQILSSSEVFITTKADFLGLFAVSIEREERHPLSSLPGAWVKQSSVGLKGLELLGAQIAPIEEYLSLSSIDAWSSSWAENLGVDDARKILEELSKSYQTLVDEVFGKEVLILSEFTEVLRQLCRDRISIRDTRLIVESIAEFQATKEIQGSRGDWMNGLVQFIRSKLTKDMLSSMSSESNTVPVFIISDEVEEEFRKAIVTLGNFNYELLLEPEFEHRFEVNVRKMFQPVWDRGALPVVILCNTDVREAIDTFCNQKFSSEKWLRTVAFQDLSGDQRIQTVGVLTA